MSNPIGDLKQQLLAAAERQQAHPAPSEDARRWASAPAINREHEQRGRALRRIRTRPAYIMLAAAALAAAAAAALFVSTPWHDSPGLLERAQAALTPPAGTILHEKSEMTWISTDPACTVTRGPSEIWIDQEPPHRYRAVLLNDLPPEPPLDPRSLVCSGGTASELGGTFDPHCTATGCEPSLRFTPPNTLSHQQIPFRLPTGDFATELRNSLGAGRAHPEGKTQLNGRTVERIRVGPPTTCPPGCPREPIYLYVDPETFYPVEIHGYGSIDGLWVRIVTRYLTYEYLPRTAANLALTDIRAQHPNAVGP
jgi:hypothetical protein